MIKLSAALIAGMVLSIAAWAASTPASALGGCGPNRHRNAYGYCVWGGQNEDWCLRHTGHRAVRMWNGNLRCFR